MNPKRLRGVVSELVQPAHCCANPLPAYSSKRVIVEATSFQVTGNGIESLVHHKNNRFMRVNFFWLAGCAQGIEDYYRDVRCLLNYFLDIVI
jgi:hypothetical protein